MLFSLVAPLFLFWMFRIFMKPLRNTYIITTWYLNSPLFQIFFLVIFLFFFYFFIFLFFLIRFKLFHSRFCWQGNQEIHYCLWWGSKRDFQWFSSLHRFRHLPQEFPWVFQVWTSHCCTPIFHLGLHFQQQTCWNQKIFCLWKIIKNFFFLHFLFSISFN